MSIIVPTIRSPICRPIDFGIGRGLGKAKLPPIIDKLVVWLKGPLATVNTRQDFANNFNFTQQNCDTEIMTDLLGNPMTDLQGNPMYVVLSGGDGAWDCEYLAPSSGQDGHTEIIAVDPNNVLIDTSGNSIANDKTALYAIDASEDYMWFCEQAGKGLLVYDLTLTQDEIDEVDAWITPCVV